MVVKMPLIFITLWTVTTTIFAMKVCRQSIFDAGRRRVEVEPCSNGSQFVHTQAHNHPPDVLYTEVLAHRRAITNNCRSVTHMSFSEIVRSEKRNIVNPGVRCQLTLRRLRPAMQRARSEVYPALPEDLPGLTRILEDPALENLTSTTDFQDSIYLGSAIGLDGSHNIVFMSRRCLQLFQRATLIFGDGTFFITPSLVRCYQVFTLVAIEGHTVIPLCWCLMERKTQLAYEAILLLIRSRLPPIRLTKAICDFEDGMMNAFRNILGVEVQGCLFHAANDFARHAKVNIGIRVIRQHVELESIIRLCCALPLLPQPLLQRGLNVIGTQAMFFGFDLYLILRPFLSYIQYMWLDHVNRGPTLSVCGSEHRTNNASESNNRRMKRKFGVHHPNTFHFLRQVANFEQESMDDVNSLSVGLIPTRHRAASAISNDRFITHITNNLLRDNDPSDNSILVFLSGAAMSVKGIVDDQLH